MVDSDVGFFIYLLYDDFVGSDETLQVLESLWTVAEGKGRESSINEMHSGAEDERGKLRSIQGAWKWEEDEEFKCRDQMEASDLVLSVSHHYLACFCYGFGCSCLQIYALCLGGEATSN